MAAIITITAPDPVRAKAAVFAMTAKNVMYVKARAASIAAVCIATEAVVPPAKEQAFMTMGLMYPNA